MLEQIIDDHRTLINQSACLRIVLDDLPTKHYGYKIEGTGYHHHPTPERTDSKICYDHSWVVAVLVITHLSYGEISFPIISAELSLRQKEIDKLKDKYQRHGQPKTEMTVNIVKKILVLTRLRCNAALFEVPRPPKVRGCGRSNVYGDKINVIGKVNAYHGWQEVECVQYGK
jgi:hypothetical protein